MTRAEYLASAKRRALRILDEGDAVGAVAAMTKSLKEHPETNTPDANWMALALLIGGQPSSEAVRQWINDFN